MHPPFAPVFLLFAAGMIFLAFHLRRKPISFASPDLAFLFLLLFTMLFARPSLRVEISTVFALFMILMLLWRHLGWSAHSLYFPWEVRTPDGSALMSKRFHLAALERRDVPVTRAHSESFDYTSEHLVDAVKCGFFDFAPVTLLAIDSTGYVVAANRHFQELLMLPLHEIVGKRWFEEFVPADEREYCLELFHRSLDSGDAQFFESTIIDGAQRRRVIRWKCCVARIEGKSVVLYCGEDITELESEHIELVKTVGNLNRLTEELENRVHERTRDLETTNRNLELHLEERDVIERQLVNSERLHMAMAHNFPNGIIAVLDQHLRFVLVDGRELKALGYSSESLMGKYIYSEEFGLDREAVESLMTAFTGDTTLVEVTFKGVFYSLTAVPLPDHENQIEKILVVFQNITQHKKLEQSLYSSIDQERKLNELKSRFLAMASHEFRTPLSTILSSVFLLENYNGLMYEQNKQHHLGRIKRTINMLTESLNDFLRLGRLEEGRIKLILADTNIRDYANEIVREIQPVLKLGQEIRYMHQGIDFNVLLDRNLTRGILLNLLSNASKYSPENAQVLLHTCLSEEQLTICVIDKGLGIPPEEQKHVFDRFFRAVNALHIEGTGLGLHIVKKYVELMNGAIDFKSDDTGTTFTVDIPLKWTQDNTRLILR